MCVCVCVCVCVFSMRGEYVFSFQEERLSPPLWFLAAGCLLINLNLYTTGFLINDSARFLEHSRINLLRTQTVFFKGAIAL
jgi:hypothetical protein